MNQISRRTAMSALAGAPAILAKATKPPNIIWLTGEDMNPELGCYGAPQMRTPNLDRMASEGVRFTHAYTTAPVCSAARSAVITGMYQTTIGAHNHRSHRKDGYKLPDGVEPITDRLRAKGYFTCDVVGQNPGKQMGKTDFNWDARKVFDGTHWSQRPDGAPVFAHINFQAPHKGPAFPLARKQKYLVDPAKLDLPPYWPDHPVVRDEYANHLDAINLLDTQVGSILDSLKKDGLLDNSIVFFYGDNGRCLIRGKQWLYENGTHVPLIMWSPSHGIKPAVRKDFALSLDINATSLMMAGIDIPEGYHGRPLVGSGAKKRDVIYTARDRCDMTVDRIRSVRTSRYRYIRNFMPDRPYTQFNNYIETSYPTLGVMKELHAAGKLNPVQSLFMAPRKPEEELYDVHADPHEVNNLALTKDHRKLALKFRQQIDEWVESTNDQGRFPEPPAAQEL